MSAVNQTTLRPPARPMRRPTPMRLKVVDINAARCGGEFIHQRTIPEACLRGLRMLIQPIVSPMVFACMRMHRRVRRCLPLPVGPWASVRRDIMAALCERAARLRRPSTIRRGRPWLARYALICAAAELETASADETDGKTAVPATARTATDRRRQRCLGDTGYPSLSAPAGLAGGLARKRLRLAWADRPFAPTTWVPRSPHLE